MTCSVGYTADAPGGQNHAMAVFRTKYIGAVGNTTCGRVGKVFAMMKNVNTCDFNSDQPCRKNWICQTYLGAGFGLVNVAVDGKIHRVGRPIDAERVKVASPIDSGGSIRAARQNLLVGITRSAPALRTTTSYTRAKSRFEIPNTD
jgi:hypothetical protein